MRLIPSSDDHQRKAGDGEASQLWRMAYEILSGMKRRGIILRAEDEQEMEQFRARFAA
jgi:hypothetical protein